MEEFQYRITVFTPTYNRSDLITNLYQSLQRQTFRDFEWLVVDDGSTDDTEQLIKSWIDLEGDFPIRYIKQANGGKCRAINQGLKLLKGELFINVDSDDYLTDDALEKIDFWVRDLPENEGFCGVVGNLGTSLTETPNTPVKAPYREASLLERYPEYSGNPIDGERAFVFYSKIRKDYPYPEFDGENFVTPAVAWNRMAHDGFKVRVFNDIIWVYEFQEGGLTLSGNRRFLDNPQGHGLWLREKARFCGYSLKKRLLMYYNFYCDFSLSGICTMSESARYIGAPLFLIWTAAIVHKARKIQKRLSRR
ncbi:glycosyltransferase family 2 protein [Akkermansiaceae bacterium]|nr:glycosyltransferase family 2 protein [Akkermansiaceae bacterium]